MYLRLAFAVAAHMEPDILLVDEVLAVGDAEFQRKCMGRMAASEHEGRTVVFVSHNLEAIGRLCPTSLWIDDGRIRERGPTATVAAHYLASSIRCVGRRTFPDRPDQALWLLEAAVVGADGQPADAVARDAPFTLELRVRLREYVPGLDLGVDLKSLHGVRVLDEGLLRSGGRPLERPGDYTIRLRVPPILRAGDYILSVWAGSAYDDSLLCVDEAVTFRLDGGDGQHANGVVDLGVPWQVHSHASDLVVGS
jgi:hypothetical protein